jgi:hypothetical protein
MRFGRGVQAVHGLGRDHNRGVEAKADVGAVQIVIDGLGNAHAGNASLDERVGDGLRVVAADGDQRIQLVGLQDLDALLDAALDLADVGARGAQDRPTLDENPVYFFQGQRYGVVVQDTAPAL